MELGCAKCRSGIGASSSVWVHDLPRLVRTGDVILFSSKHHGAYITKFFTNSEWDHVGIVVKPTPVHVYLVEWGGGLFASNLVERLEEYYEFDGRAIHLRQLEGLDDEKRSIHEDTMEAFLDFLFRESLGSNPAIPLDQVMRAARRQLTRRSSSSIRSSEPVLDDLTLLFCSKLLAVTFKAAGLIAPNRDAADFLPKHFSLASDSFLDMQGGARLGAEARLTFEPRAVHETVRTILAFAGAANDAAASLFEQFERPEVRAARTVQRCVRRFIARRRRMRARQESEARKAERAAALGGPAVLGTIHGERAVATARSGKERRALLRLLAEHEGKPAPPRAHELRDYGYEGYGYEAEAEEWAGRLPGRLDDAYAGGGDTAPLLGGSR